MSDQEIKTELSSQGVINVSRFVLKKEGKEIKTNTLFVTFDSHKLPRENQTWLLYSQYSTLCPEPVAMF